MRIVTGVTLLAVLVACYFSASVQARGVATKHASSHTWGSPLRQQQPLDPQPQRQWPAPPIWLGRRRKGGWSERTIGECLLGVRGGRSSNTVIFAEALAETALETGCILAFVSATSYISDLYATKEFAEVAKLAVWTGTVFLSGAATAGPRRWLETSQLFNIDSPISEEWYAKLRKPWWNPPNWVFPIMWVPLKILQVFACFEMWEKLDKRSFASAPLVVYGVYKSLGDVWNKVFFERRSLNVGTTIISFYFLTLLVGIKLFFDTSIRAGYLFAPTAGWVLIATCLQWSTWLLNRDNPPL